MSSKENKEFMRLIKASFNTSSYAVRNFITSNVIPNGKTFTDFLDDVLHDLYHKYQNQLPCCFPGCEDQSFPREQKLIRFIFFQLYEFTKGTFSCKTGGRGRKIIQVDGAKKRYCSCNVRVLAHVTLQNLDISTLNKILQETGNSNPHIAALCDVRNKICHVPSTTSLTHQKYMKLWTTVETEVLNLADRLDPSVKDMIKEQLELIKTCEIDVKTAEELMKKVEELKIMTATNTEEIKNLRHETIEIKAHVDDKLQKMSDQQMVNSEILENQAVIQVKEDIAKEGLATRAHFDKQLKLFMAEVLEDVKKNVVGTSTDNVKEEQNDCSSCDQKDIQMKKLEEINSKFKERKWRIKRFLSQPDNMYQPDMEDISDDHSDYWSGCSSGIEIEELTDEEFTDNSDYKTSSVRLESTPIQCYVESSFESSLEQLRLMMREQSLDGREKLRIQIIFKEERDMNWTSDILKSFKEENNDRFSGIEFFHVSSINKG